MNKETDTNELEQRISEIQERYKFGRWGNDTPDAVINSTQDLIILSYQDTEIDHFSAAVDRLFWLYDLVRDKEIKMLGQSPLRYEYLQNSKNTSETGVARVEFDKDDPHKIIITYVKPVDNFPDEYDVLIWTPDKPVTELMPSSGHRVSYDDD